MGRPRMAILEINKKGVILGYFDTISEAALLTKINRGYVVQVLMKQKKSAMGRYFRYASWEEIQKKKEILEWLEKKDELKSEAVTPPVPGLPEAPVETIPSTWTKPDEAEVGLTAFDLLLKRSRERVGIS